MINQHVFKPKLLLHGTDVGRCRGLGVNAGQRRMRAPDIARELRTSTLPAATPSSPELDEPEYGSRPLPSVGPGHVALGLSCFIGVIVDGFVAFFSAHVKSPIALTRSANTVA